MTMKKLKELVNGEYIDNPIKLAESIGISETELCEFLSLVVTYNREVINAKSRSLSEHLARNATRNTPEIIETTVSQSSNVTRYVQEETQKVDEEIVKKARDILARIDSNPIENIMDFLPARDDSKFFPIMNQLMILCQQDIVFYNKYLFSSDLSDKDKSDAHELLEKRSNICEAMREARGEIREKVNGNTTNQPPTLIYLSATNGESFLRRDLSKMSPELYSDFLDIFQPFVEGQDVYTKNLGPRLKPVSCIKNIAHQSRIYMTSISPNAFVIIGAMNKKTTWGLYETEFVVNRRGIFNNNMGQILGNIDNPAFIAEQEKETEKILKLLRGDGKK